MSPEFSECLTKAIAEDLAKKESEANKSMRMLEIVGDRARNYTCADPKMETSNTSLSNITWTDPEGGLAYNAQVGGAGQGLSGEGVDGVVVGSCNRSVPAKHVAEGGDAGMGQARVVRVFLGFGYFVRVGTKPGRISPEFPWFCVCAITGYAVMQRGRGGKQNQLFRWSSHSV